jgi:hypothetical protein
MHLTRFQTPTDSALDQQVAVGSAISDARTDDGLVHGHAWASGTATPAPRPRPDVWSPPLAILARQV